MSDNYALSELDRQLSGLIMPGFICAVQHSPPRVRLESDGWQSAWLPWYAFAAGEARHWRPPSLGEQAVLLAPSGDPAAGFVLAGFYTQQYPGDGRETVTGWLMPDGAVWEHDHASSQTVLRVPPAGGITLECGPSRLVIDASGIRATAPRIDLN